MKTVFEPIYTPRLQIRQLTSDDGPLLAARRSDPEVARFQNWTLPYPLERAQAMVDRVGAMEGPAVDEWWMAAVCDRQSGQVLGDLALHLTWEGRTAEIGYTFAREHWGRGYAVEAVGALIDWLFEDREVTRVWAMLHPGNRASAMVLERSGMLFEGHTRSSYWVGDEVSDDWIYGMTKEDWRMWRNRPTDPPTSLDLVPVTPANYDELSNLKTHKSQESFVAPMLWSYSDALFPEELDGAPLLPRMRGIRADGEYVGFVMLAEVTERHPEPYLWRFLVDRLHQRRGVGHLALEAVFDECRGMGATSLLTSWVEGKGSPAPFYTRHGFVPTGRIVDGETEARVDL